MDLNHIDTAAKVTGYLPADGGLEKALSGADIVIIPAGMERPMRATVVRLADNVAGIARKPGMTRDGIWQSCVPTRMGHKD